MPKYGQRPHYPMADIEQMLIGAGVRPTAQRLALCQYLFNEADHPTADDVMAWAKANFPKITLATVYNTLNTLIDAEVISVYRFPHSERLVYDSNCSPHHHFLDEESGLLHDIPADQLSIQWHLPPQYLVQGLSVLLHGTLKDGPNPPRLVP